MSMVALALLLSAGFQSEESADPQDQAESSVALLAEADRGLPLNLADSLPQQQGLDGAPVEKSPRQDDFSQPRKDDDSMVVNFGAHARFTLPFGAADRSYATYGYGYYVVDHYLSWADFFNPGWGFEVEAEVFFGKNGPGRRRTPGFNYGLALLLQTDQYYGRSTNDGFGNNLKLDDMTATSLQIGGRVLQTLGNDFYYGGLITLGAIHYSEVMGTFNGPLVPANTRDTVFRNTYTFASNFRADGGYRLGPLGIVIGAALRINAPPSEGGRMSLNSGAFWTFDIDLGVELGF